VLRAVVAAVALLSVGSAHGNKQRGTFAVRFKAVPPTGHKVTTDDLERSVSIMRRRAGAPRASRMGTSTGRCPEPASGKAEGTTIRR
jgi:hypothetical protein